MRKFSLYILVTILSAVAANAQESAAITSEIDELYAFENDTVKNKRGQVLQEVVIIQSQKNPVQIGRSAIAPMDLPQSIQLIDSKTIKEQQSIRLSEVIRNVNGVYVGSARGGAQESFFARGYDMSANNIYKNGFRVNGGAMPEVASLEKVEVLKGSAALLYGNVSPGGILNLVTKTPQFERGGSINFQAGSYSFYKPSIDVYGPLNNLIAYRFTGSYENSESFRDVVKTERIYVNPSLLFKVNPSTEILLQADYLLDNWTPDFGTGTVDNEIADIPRNTYLGARWSNGVTHQESVSALITHRLNALWKIDFNSTLQNFGRSSEGTERIQPRDNGDWDRPLGKNKSREQILGQQISLQGQFNTGSIKHQLTTGVDFDDTFLEAYTFTFTPNVYDTVNIYTINDNPQRTDIPRATNTQIVKTATNRFGAYFQDLVSLTRQFKVLAGLRWSWQEALPETFNRVTNESSEGAKRIDAAFSPKVGIVFQPVKDISIFTSYSNSFTPNTGVTIYNEALEASIIDQYEIGIKKEFFNSKLTTNVTLYQIVNSNLSQMAEFNLDGTPNTVSTVRTLSGETTSKGVEFDLTAKPIQGLSILAGYSYNDMRYTETSGTTGSFFEGDRLVRTPAHTANASAFYTFETGALKGFSIGTIGNYIGERLGGWNNSVGHADSDREIPIDGYTTIDMSAGYKWKNVSILCRLSNITNVLNYTVHENYSVNPTAPRQFLTSLNYKF